MLIANSTVSGNSAAGGSDSPLRIPGCQEVTNHTIVPGLARPGTGGGIAVMSGTAMVLNCTVASNAAIANPGGVSFGGGIYSTGAMTLRSTVVSGNSASNAPDALGMITSDGYNLFGKTNGVSGFAISDLLNVDPKLGPLQDNGGASWTHALLAGSPAIDAGTNSGAVTDQRGQPRRVDNPSIPDAAGSDGTDIGALEVDHVLRCTEARRVNSNVLVRFTSVSDKTYGIEFKRTVRGTGWTKLSEVISGSGGIVTATNVPGPGDPTRFYRAFER